MIIKMIIYVYVSLDNILVLFWKNALRLHVSRKEVAAETCSVCDPGTFSNMSAQSDSWHVDSFFPEF